MSSRLELHEVLCGILSSRNVYYQPPESVKIQYPAIIYARTNIHNAFADNEVYKQSRAYNITVIDYDPDSEIVSAVSKLPRCRFDRHYTYNNLNHDVFTINYK